MYIGLIRHKTALGHSLDGVVARIEQVCLPVSVSL